MTPNERPPSYLPCADLARELAVSESTVRELVARGVLPKPIKLSPGCVRWCWAEVQVALASLGGSAGSSSDPFLTGVKNVAATS